MNQRDLVEFVRQSLGLRSESELAKALGQTPQGFNQRKVRNTLSIDEFKSLFIENNKDPNLVDSFLFQQEEDATPTPKQDYEIGASYRKIPEYNVRVSAGHGEYQGIEHVKQELQIPKQWLPENGKIGLVKVEGDSMWPTINHGDFVAVEFGSGYTSDGLYLVRVEDSAYVKRLQKEFGSIRIISDNPQYREMTVSPDDGNDFGLIGRVALIVRKT